MPYGNVLVPVQILYGKINIGSGSANANLTEKNIDSNGTYSAKDEGYDGFSTVNVDVKPNLQQKGVNPTTEVQYVGFDDGYDGLLNVTVGAIQTEEAVLTANGTYTPEDGKFFSKVVVNIPTDISLGESYEYTFATKSLTATQYSTPYTRADSVSVLDGEIVLNDPVTSTPTELNHFKLLCGKYFQADGKTYFVPYDSYMNEVQQKNDIGVVQAMAIKGRVQEVTTAVTELPDAEGVAF